MVTNLTSSEWAISIEGQGKIVQGIAAIKQRMFIVLNTIKGTDPLRPGFAINLLDWVDKPVNVALPNLKVEIINALTEFMPEITIDTIDAVLTETNKITYTIHFLITNAVKTDQFDVTYGLNSSNT